MVDKLGARDQQDGFTLVELLVAVVVLGIAIAGIAGLYYNMQVMQARSQNRDIATRAARTEIEVLRNNSYASLQPNTTLDFTASLPSSLPSDRTGSVAITQPVDGLRRVDVSVTYTDHGQAEKVELSSDIGIIGIGQGT